jgi:hypothetical protein
LKNSSAPRDEFESFFARVLTKLKEIPPEEEVRWYDLLRMIFSWAMERRPGNEQPKLRDILVKSQPKARQKRVQNMIKTGADVYREEGREEGSLETARKFLLKIGQPKLGKPSKRIRQQIEAIITIDRFDRLADFLLSESPEVDITSWQQLLEIK